MNYQITCITRSTPFGGHEHITHVGGTFGTMTVEDVIRRIEHQHDTFYVVGPTGKVAIVGVVRPAGQRPYIRTHADGYYNDNLLSLGACPMRYAA